MDTPELDKMSAARGRGSQEIGEFLEWMLNSRGVQLSVWAPQPPKLVPCPGVDDGRSADNCVDGKVARTVTEQVGTRTIKFVHMEGEVCPVCEGRERVAQPQPAEEVRWGSSIQEILAEYFEVDLEKVEQERRALLEEQRVLNERRDGE